MKNSMLHPAVVMIVLLFGLSFYKIYKLEQFVGTDTPIVPMDEVKVRFEHGRNDAKNRLPPAETEYFYLQGYGFAVKHDL